MKLLSHIIFNLQIIFGVASFFVSIYSLKFSSTPKYLKLFVGYTSIAFLLIIPGFIIFYFLKDLIPIMNSIFLVSTIYHYCFLGVFIIEFTNGEKKGWIYSMALFFLFLIIYFVFTEFSNKYSRVSFSISALGLIMLCLIYFYRLIKNPSRINLFTFPAFWIVVGIFLSMGLQFPFAATFDSFYKKVSFEKYLFMYGIITLSYVILHGFIIKSYLCSIKNSKSLLSL